MWILFACLSALFAGVTSVLAKAGVATTASSVATALRTVVVAAGAWGMAALAGSATDVFAIDARSLLFLLLSGLATGASWLCYFAALSRGDVSRVAPIDKLSTVLTILLALVLLGEAVSAWGTLGIIAITAGTLLMVEPTDLSGLPRALRQGGSWLIYALASAFFAALTSILGKVGVSGVDPTLGTAVRTLVVLAMAWGIVAAQGRTAEVRLIPTRELAFIIASGAATCASWLAYYHALKGGPASIVVPIDKLSILVTVGFSALAFHERFTRRYLVGLAVICAGTVAMVVA
ncbi:multidrug DMT transporter permease [Schaalia meyeri]|uniref:EamA family transporter n=1 Tax=Schaalia meyeri TaxID=52773 RepID=UPI000682A31B|nr:EamA family transporter [Schaalia meyeri]AKU64562.1 multidrug DMT transporter permease [Schaalia meyeri]